MLIAIVAVEVGHASDSVVARQISVDFLKDFVQVTFNFSLLTLRWINLPVEIKLEKLSCNRWGNNESVHLSGSTKNKSCIIDLQSPHSQSR